MKQSGRKKTPLSVLFRTEQQVAQFADLFQFFLHAVIIAQPTFDLLFLLGADTNLLVPAAGVID